MVDQFASLLTLEIPGVTLMCYSHAPGWVSAGPKGDSVSF